MDKITISAPGKVHLLGEHAIVYGRPAILTAIDKRCFVTLIPHKKTKIKITSKQLDKTLEISLEQIIGKQKDAEYKWQEYLKSNNVALLKSITQNDLDLVVITIGETLKYLKLKKTQAFDLKIDSQIPIGAGLGSSAAVVVSTIAAIFVFLNLDLDKEKMKLHGLAPVASFPLLERINEIAFLAEQRRHGMPSGGDNSTVTYGGMVWFRKESPELKIIKPIPFSLPESLAKNFVLIDTGRPKESTGEMVAVVKKLIGKRPKWTEEIFNDQERQVKKLLQAIKENNERGLIEAIREGERNLERIGVVSQFSHDLIRKIENLGGVAKICGAGGKTDKTGVLLTYHQDVKQIIKLADSTKVAYYQVKLGAEGVKEEQV